MDSVEINALTQVLPLGSGEQKQERQTQELLEVELSPIFKAMEILSCTMALSPLWDLLETLLFGTLTHVQDVLLEAKELGCISPVTHLRVHAKLACASLLIYLVEGKSTVMLSLMEIHFNH